MELRRLRYFQVIAEEGSLSGASRALGIAQPALGRQMQLLEESLGTKLFVRMPKGMLLTDEGRYLKNALPRPMSELADALKNVRSYSRGVEASVNLGIYQPLSRLFGAPLISQLQSSNPNINVRVTEDKASRLRNDLESGAIDIAITLGSPSGLNFEMLAVTEPLFLLVRNDSIYSGYSKITLSDLSKIPLILDGDPGITANTLQKVAWRLGGTIIIDRKIDSAPIIVEMVRYGLGCSVFTLSDVKFEDIKHLKMIPIDIPGISRNVYYAVRQHWHIPPPIYFSLHDTLFGVWRKLLNDGTWKAEWVGEEGFPEL